MHVQPASSNPFNHNLYLLLVDYDYLIVIRCEVVGEHEVKNDTTYEWVYLVFKKVAKLIKQQTVYEIASCSRVPKCLMFHRKGR